MDIEKTCDNCKYFERHYIKTPKRFSALYCGHCKNYVSKHKSMIENSSKKTCENWQPSEENAVKQQQNIEIVLRQAAKDINGIATILYSNKK